MAKKRFIAGAICPQCQVEDRLVVEDVDGVGDVDGVAQRRCVSCGFSDRQVSPTEVTLPTRFVRRGLENVDVETVRLPED